MALSKSIPWRVLFSLSTTAIFFFIGCSSSEGASVSAPRPQAVRRAAQPQKQKRPPTETTTPLFLESAGAPMPEAEIPLNSLAPLVRRVKPGVVNIYTLSIVPSRGRRARHFGDSMDELFRNYFDGAAGSQARQSLGTGFILNSDGLVLTNNHVVEGATEIRIKLDDGREFSARPIGLDRKSDVALLKLEGEGVKDLPVVVLGDSDALQVGDFTLAVGNPFGLDHSVSLGIVSAKERVIGAGPYDDFIQTDTAINPGNSGGPLFNLRGEVVGVNTAIMAQGQGIGFAVPINMVKALLPQLIKGQVLRGWLGVSVQDIPTALVPKLGLARPKGALVVGVIREGPAHRAGILPGDVVTAVADKPIETYNQFSRTVAALEPGKPARLRVLREGKALEIEADVGHRPDERPLMALRKGGAPAPNERIELGLSLRELPRARQKRLGLSGGVEITAVDPESPIGRGGAQPGDVIIEMQRKSIQGLSDFAEIAQTLKPGERLLLRLQRGDSAIYVAVLLP
ncbi:MAG: Do family serine endopeptidase [Myxococcales bacterium]|jgi:serine protease Do|nr:Do family serine endopeptidase [Myxococcales bacterium]